jgi:16S rRNA (adenine1518-N6/adenine1519-N6)-dimethyltransferase
MQRSPRKRFSQNFLVDEHYIAAALDALRPERGDRIIEIGPGRGALTRSLAAAAAEFHAIEIDRDLARDLTAELGTSVHMHVADVLKFDFAPLGAHLRVVGNLPYHISTPILFHLASFSRRLRDIHALLQAELVSRMAATPADSNHGRLSLMLQYRFVVERLFDVPASAFHPRPEVDSAMVRLTPLNPLPHPAYDEQLFEQIVTRAFSGRRKMLRNALSDFASVSELTELGLCPTARPQELGVAEFVTIANHVARRHGRYSRAGHAILSK